MGLASELFGKEIATLEGVRRDSRSLPGRTGFSLIMNIEHNPWWTRLFTLTAKAGLKLEVSIVKISVETDEFVLFSKILAQAGGNPHPSVNALLTFSEFAVGTRISNQYQPLGIRFSGATIPYISRDGSSSNSPVLSGGDGFGSALTGSFVNQDGSDRTVSTFTLVLGYIDRPGSTEVLAYDSAGSLLQTSVANVRGFAAITIQRPGIQSFIVRSTGVEDSGWGIDNVSFVGFTRPTGVNDLAAAGGEEPAGPTEGSTRGTS